MPGGEREVVLERNPGRGPEIRQRMGVRIRKVLAVAEAHGHEHLVLGAWGCGAFGNDPEEIADLFKLVLAGEFRDAFEHVVFAITDWSAQRRFIGLFERAFA